MTTSHDTPYPPPKHDLREWRVARGLSRYELAETAGATESAIARYETGENRIAFEMLFRLMEALGITPLQFFEPPDLPPWWRWIAVRSPRLSARPVCSLCRGRPLLAQPTPSAEDRFLALPARS